MRSLITNLLRRVPRPTWTPPKPRKDLTGIEKTNRAANAKSVLNNDAFKEAFDELEARYLKHWRMTAVEDIEKREYAYLCVNALDDVRKCLHTYIAIGRLEEDSKKPHKESFVV